MEAALNTSRTDRSPPVPIYSPDSWRAQLRLQFQASDKRTILAHRWHQGPLQVQRPFYPEGDDLCHLYILHPPGGVVPGDQLQIEARVDPNAHVLLTTPASGKIYRSHGPQSSLTNSLQVAANASLEWFPQETILFDGALTTMQTQVQLTDESSQFMGWEILCLGRPASKKLFETGSCRQSFEIWRDQAPLWIEKSHYEGGSALLSSPWGMNTYPVSGTFVCVTQSPPLIDAIRTKFEDSMPSDCFLTATQLKHALIVRYLGHHAEQAKKYFTRAWEIVRPEILGRPICSPRIWKT